MAQEEREGGLRGKTERFDGIGENITCMTSLLKNQKNILSWINSTEKYITNQNSNFKKYENIINDSPTKRISII